VAESFAETIQKKLSHKKKEYNFYDIWDVFMLNYGYISKKDLLEMDAKDVDELVKRINDRIPKN
jgi:hypothetical protein